MDFLIAYGKIKCLLIFGLVVVVVTISAYNATLIFDDLYIVGRFNEIDKSLTWLEIIRFLGLSLDLAPREYRLYGLSRLIHFFLWEGFGSHAAPYAVVIVVTQIVSGYGLARLMMREGADEFQANVVWAAWVFSPFLVTSCFHHYSYLILPYQISVLCALALRFRAISFALGIAIALTGEEHLAASCLLLILVALGAKGRSRRQGAVDAAVPVFAIVGAVVVHRLLWLSVVGAQSAPVRFALDVSGVAEAITRLRVWFGTLLPGMAEQGIDLLKFASNWSLLIVGAIVVAAAIAKRNPPGGSMRPAVGVALVCVASFVILGALAALTGQISPSLPRRYGFVPYTLCVITIIVTLLAPNIRRVFGTGPAIAALSIHVGFWMLLQFVVLPVTRAQDQQVWNSVERSLSAKGPQTNILFVSDAFPEAPKHPSLKAIDSVAFRPGLSAIFESAFQGFWWESQYAIVKSGAAFAAYRWEDVDDHHLKLVGSDASGLPPRVVSRSSIVVLYDQRRDPYSANDPRGVTTFLDWQKFIEAYSARERP